MPEINVKIDDSGLSFLLALASDKVKIGASKVLRSNALGAMKEIKSTMPVDTGRARASWGIWTPGDLSDPPKAYAAGASEDDTIWQESADGMEITQGTNVPYVEDLNNGTSQQAGAGFIDSAAKKFAQNMELELNKLIEDIL